MKNDAIITELEDGEFLATDIIEVFEIPDIAILNTNLNERETTLKVKNTFKELLSEIYISCNQNRPKWYENDDYSIEIVFSSTEVENQTFNAKVNIYIILRGINENKEFLVNKISELKNLVKVTLNYSKFSIKEIDKKLETLEQIKYRFKQNKRAIVKDTEVQQLQNMYIPQVDMFDRFAEKITNCTKIVNTLMQYPNSQVIIDLIPTVLNSTESTGLEQLVNTLDILKNNLQNANSNFSTMFIDKVLSNYRYYEERKNGPMFLYNIVVCANELFINNIISNLNTEFGMTEDANIINLKNISIDNTEIDIDTYFYSLPWVFNEIILDKTSSNTINSVLKRLPYMVTMEEATEFFRLPYGDNCLTAGININRLESGIKEYSKKVINNGDIIVGNLKNAGNSNTKIGFDLGDLVKHMLIVGTPGSGKTTFSIGLLDRIWKEFSIPFLVIEPAKNEYRAMIDSIPDIQVFTPGKDFISPYIINPFIPPKNVRLQSYKTVLKTAFSAAIELTTPLDKLFEETLDECYSNAGWLPYYTIDDGGDIFTMDDFLKTFMQVFERIGYKGEASNIGKAGYVRLKSLLRIFGSYNTIPVEDLLKKPTIIELAAIENEKQKSLIIALLLLNIQSYINANYIGTGEMKNLLLLEEAHVLLGASDKQSDGDANPSAVAKELLVRMFAEIRALGLSMVIADQSPEKVTSDIIKLTNIKLAFNLVEQSDRVILGNSTAMNDKQKERLTQLGPGEAYFYMNGLKEPEEVITENYREKVNIRTTISDDEIAKRTTYWKDKQDKLKPYLECQFINCCNDGCDYRIRAEADEYSRRIYSKYFNEESKDKELLVQVYSNFKEELDAVVNKDINNKLLWCTKVHFLRRIIYYTKINFSKKAARKTLLNEINKEAKENE